MDTWLVTAVLVAMAIYFAYDSFEAKSLMPVCVCTLAIAVYIRYTRHTKLKQYQNFHSVTIFRPTHRAIWVLGPDGRPCAWVERRAVSPLGHKVWRLTCDIEFQPVVRIEDNLAVRVVAILRLNQALSNLTVIERIGGDLQAKLCRIETALVEAAESQIQQGGQVPFELDAPFSLLAEMAPFYPARKITVGYTAVDTSVPEQR